MKRSILDIICVISFIVFVGLCAFRVVRLFILGMEPLPLVTIGIAVSAAIGMICLLLAHCITEYEGDSPDL